jgi:K+-sensing histidine kinase KdpD
VLLDESQDSAVFVSTNTRLFVRALVNLLFNAVKFSPPNSSIRLQVIHTKEKQDAVEIATISIQNQIELNTNSSDMIPSMPGFGLGLDFVDTVIHKHHGTITRDIPDSGIATIRVTLPCSSN